MSKPADGVSWEIPSSQTDAPDVRRGKFAYDPQTGRLEVWQVDGPGDGRPSHREMLNDRWGRDGNPTDVFGLAIRESAPDGVGEVRLISYANAVLPEDVAVEIKRRVFEQLEQDGAV